MSPELLPQTHPHYPVSVISLFLVSQVRKGCGVDLRKDAMGLQRVHEAALKAAMALVDSDETEVSAPFITANDAGPYHLEFSFSRAQLDEFILMLDIS